jgi:hypothetical protein
MTLARTLCGVTALTFAASSAIAQQDFGSRTQFGGVMKSHGKALKGPETYEESTLPPAMGMIINGPLVPLIPNGPFPTGLEESNLEVYSHVNPNPGIFSPRGGADLFVASTGGASPFASDVVLTQVFGDSLDLVIVNGTHSGVGFDVISEHATQGARITVYDTNNVFVGQYLRNGNSTGAGTFFGIYYPLGIGRVNIATNDTLRIGADDIETWMVPAPSGVVPLLLAVPMLGRRRRTR